jgi:hypothetical protein
MRVLNVKKTDSCRGRFDGTKATAVQIALADLIHMRVRSLLR